MLNLSTQALLEANSLQQEGVWLILLEINLPGATPIRVVRNTGSITWGGYTWTAFPFEIEDVTEDSKGETPSLTIKVSNVTKALQPYVEQARGGNGGEVILRVINTTYLEGTAAEIEESFEINHATCDNKWVTFELGGDAVLNGRFPPRRILKNRCPYVYKGIECGSTAALTSCPRTLDGCEARGNYDRFGGESGIPQGGLYVQ